MLSRLRDLALPLAVWIGVLFHRSITVLVPFIPALVFVMLLLSFCSVSPKEIRFTRQHIFLLLAQIGFSLLLYAALLPWNKTIAQAVSICVLAPTAAAAPAITSMLGGRVSFEASFVFLDNVAVALFAPVFFTCFGDVQSLSFGASVCTIAFRVVPVIIFPLLLAWLLERVAKSVHDWMISIQWTTFYMWVVATAVSAGQITGYLTGQDNSNYTDELLIAAITLLLCLAQFRLGRMMGKFHRNYIGTEQAFGQKNTVLAIWMAQTFLNPMAAIGPGAYHLWQSCVNSYQLFARRKK